MRATHSINIEEIAYALAAMIRSDDSARRIYGRQAVGFAELWLLTDAIDLDHEMRIYELAATLDREFANSAIDFHLVNPVHFEPFTLEDVVPVRDSSVRLLREL